MSKRILASEVDACMCQSALMLFRNRTKMSQQKCAEKLGISRYRVSNLELGKEPMSQTMYSAIVGMIADYEAKNNRGVGYLDIYTIYGS